jgi:hypothetical protein
MNIKSLTGYANYEAIQTELWSGRGWKEKDELSLGNGLWLEDIISDSEMLYLDGCIVNG